MPLPELFVQRLRKIAPQDKFEGVLASFYLSKQTSFRINTLAAEEEDVLHVLSNAGIQATEIQGVAGGYSVSSEQRDPLSSSSVAREGLIYVQNASSQLPPLILDPQPGEHVLDLCAAPGSKTRQLACIMEDTGEIVAVEKVRKRFYKLKSNLQEQGSRCVVPRLANGAAYWHKVPESFDRVLVDAPCSTEGRFREADPETTRYWSIRKIKEMRSKQRKLLFSGIQLLKPGGTLVYSTCSFAPEENEVVVSKLLKTFGEAIELLPIGTEISKDAVQTGITHWSGRQLGDHVSLALRVLPDETFEGFFVARFLKKRSTIRK